MSPVWRVMAIAIAFYLVAVAMVLLIMSDARSHTAPSGMPYPSDCCTNDGKECAPISEKAIRETPDGYFVTLEPGDHPLLAERASKLFPYASKSIKPSMDGATHACASHYQFEKDSKAIPTIHCIIVPPKGF